MARHRKTRACTRDASGASVRLFSPSRIASASLLAMLALGLACATTRGVWAQTSYGQRGHGADGGVGQLRLGASGANPGDANGGDAAGGSAGPGDSGGNAGPTGPTDPTGSTDPTGPTDPEGPDEPGEPVVPDPPTLGVDCDELDAGRVVGSTAHFGRELVLSVRMEGTELSAQDSVVCGVALEDLLSRGSGQAKTEDGKIAFDDWSISTDGEGRSCCLGTVTLLDGSYNAKTLAKVVDARGDEAAFAGWDGFEATSLVVDTVAPRVQILGISSGMYTNRPANVLVRVWDERWDDVIAHDAEQVVATLDGDGSAILTLCAGCEGMQREGEGYDYPLTVPAANDHADDGVYRLLASATDLAGNTAQVECPDVVVDTTRPRVRVSLDYPRRCGDAEDGPIFDAAVAAHVVVCDKNLSVDDLNHEPGLVGIRPITSRGATVDSVTIGSWRQAASQDTYCCDLSFWGDGTYALEVSGADRAQNPLGGDDDTPVSEDGTYTSEPFVIDLTDPQVSVTLVPPAAKVPQVGGLPCYARAVTVRVRVVDRNFDAQASLVTNSLGKQVPLAWSVRGTDGGGNVTHEASCVYVEESAGLGAGLKRAEAQVADLSGHLAAARVEFVVDQTAPKVVRAAVGKRPVVMWPLQAKDSPFYFYAERDGVPTTLDLDLQDEYGLADAWVDDPDGAYTAHMEYVHGKTQATVRLRLKDHVAHGASHDTTFERNVRVFVRDIAGNVRVWSLGERGMVDADRIEDATNVSLGGEGVYPQALVNDVTAPQVSLEGPAANSYHRQDQSVRIRVDEYGFGWLQRLDPERIVATVSKRTADAAQTRSTWTVPVSSFAGDAPLYACEQAFGEDGHYQVAAQLQDAAGNSSPVAVLEEFTIDKTAPVITVTWDNEDARNGKFYRTSRTATITVVEHDFDASAMSVVTTGTTGPWESHADTHTCAVTFAADSTVDAPHRLSVSGADMAGNEAQPYRCEDFVIDTKAPTVQAYKAVSTTDPFVADSERTDLLDGTAYAQAFRPVVVCKDEANLDMARTVATMGGMRPQNDVGRLAADQMAGDNELTFDWGNVGADPAREGGGYALAGDDVYTITAQATDLAGNESQEVRLRFSLNRFGSNYVFEDAEGSADPTERAWQGELLTSAPRIVVHEINVSGFAAGEDSGDAHMVTKEHAFSTTAIRQTTGPERSGYTVEAAGERDQRGPEGWFECVYTIAPGNFGRGSDSDFGDGGQGLYQVDVSSTDVAGNHNTTAAFWDSDEGREQDLGSRSSTASFTLDEDGPRIEDVVLPEGLSLGGGFDASFYVRDEIGEGDRLSVWVDGEPVQVRRDGSDEAVANNELLEQGRFRFWLVPRPAWVPRSLRICVGDYTGLEDRTDAYEADGFVRSTGWAELGVLLACGVVVLVCVRLVHGALARIGKGGRHGRTD